MRGRGGFSSADSHLIIRSRVTQLPRLKLALLLVTLLIAATPESAPIPYHGRALWPGARYTDRDRDVAVERGLEFIDRVASDSKHFAAWGDDLLFCFYTIYASAKNEHLKQKALQLGQEHARQWRALHTEVPHEYAGQLVNFVAGVDSSERLLGIHDESLKKLIQEAASHYSAQDFYGFDPRREPPPSNIPGDCGDCEGTRKFRNPYNVWMAALIVSYLGDHYGLTLVASHPDVVRWISAMRPYPSIKQLQANEDEFDDVTYAITHVIYTLNDYGKHGLSRTSLPEEFKYLRANLVQAIKFEDPEILGEFLDSLRAFGMDERDPEIRTGMEYLLERQNKDGSWGDTDETDIYIRYHATWTAVDGLREYAFSHEPIRLPTAKFHDRAKAARIQLASRTRTSNRHVATVNQRFQPLVDYWYITYCLVTSIQSADFLII